MNNLPSRQRGLTFISMVLVFGLIAFFTLLILKIVPVYLENFKVSSSLQSLKEDPGIMAQSPKGVKSKLMKRFDVNMIEGVTEDDITVTKQGQYLKVAVSYEVVKNIAGNLDVLVTFDEKIEVGSH